MKMCRRTISERAWEQTGEVNGKTGKQATLTKQQEVL